MARLLVGGRRAGVAVARWCGLDRRRPVDPGPVRLRLRLDDGSLTFVYQPIVDLRDGTTVGFEGLTRFTGSAVPVGALFEAAARHGSLLELELHAVSAILTGAEGAPIGTYLSVNASPSTLATDAFAAAVAAFPLDRLVVEVNEREVVGDYATLRAAIAGLRAAGLRLAVDDAGAGVASLHHLVELRPEIIKLDGALTDAIDRHPGQRAMARALSAFAGETGAEVVAEGVESLQLARALSAVGVAHGQGFALGRPAPATWPSR